MEQREGGFKKLCLTLKAGLEGERGEDLDYSSTSLCSRALQCGRLLMGGSALDGVLERMLGHLCAINSCFQT